ncbi:dihydroxyacetone kinase protein [Rhizobium freirei PRF 81]|uniref:Dihydroxyacetone kinase protein n=1 Tax=Rhizobium freirei PRF 81 TaxID=363754 RepID=N6UV51_9HYPH|nr:dihydroxyacetone kinase subunit DhaK [Rhizobium freirei]ENN84626.1 dihydroxyacetone kinase protein [Rhizobium freirei PRF 81]
MHTFFNRKEDIVSEAIDGLVAASGGRLVRFSADSSAKVVLRADWQKSGVAIISGGGSGHEPSHAGLVADGLLTAAVCGEVFASPSVDAILAGIVAVTGEAGCLLVVKNYTGDRLNFGLAAEKAKGLGLKVQMVIVADDLATSQSRQPRGIAGTLFIHKIAGHLARAGASLEDISAAVEQANRGIVTIGAARDTCTVPGNPKLDRIGPDEVEIGLGIHGEAGVEIAAPASSRALIDDLVSRLAPRLKPDAEYAAIFNNLGGLSNLECLVLFADLMKSALRPKIRYIAGPDAVMTALEMPGFSISLLELTPEREILLTSPTASSHFPQFERLRDVQPIAAPVVEANEVFAASRDDRVRAVVETIIAACISMEGAINALDAKVGDGDTGSTFAGAARMVQAAIDTLPFADGSALFAALSDLKRKAMGGSSGVLFAIMMARSADACRHSQDWVSALAEGLDAMQQYGGAKLGDRTMIDALSPALAALGRGEGMAPAAAAARLGADATANMTRANAGRSSYLDARSLEGIADPGAEAIARIFEALAAHPR